MRNEAAHENRGSGTVAFFAVPTVCWAFGGDSRLAGHDGSTFALNDAGGKVVLLACGYTYCPDVYRTMLAEMAHAVRPMGPLTACLLRIVDIHVGEAGHAGRAQLACRGGRRRMERSRVGRTRCCHDRDGAPRAGCRYRDRDLPGLRRLSEDLLDEYLDG